MPGFIFLILTQDMFLLLLQRERKGERSIDVKEEHRLLASPRHPNQGSNSQPKNVPCPGIKPTTFWSMGWCSNQQSHLARAHPSLLTEQMYSVAGTFRK